MGFKIQTALKRSKGSFILVAILWVILTIVFVVPFSYSLIEARTSSGIAFEKLIESFSKGIMQPFSTFGKVLGEEYIGTFFKTFGLFSVIYLTIAIIGIIRAMPKHEYADIEHGSSDWCANGEEYRVLSKDKGILLAEKHFLPLDKRGNINVLVVGRFWFW